MYLFFFCLLAINCSIYLPNLIFWLWYVNLRSLNIHPSDAAYPLYVEVRSSSTLTGET